MKKTAIIIIVLLMTFMVGCTKTDQESPSIILATTTSTYDSGLLDVLLPVFEETYNIKVEVISVGTGQGVEIGKRGDCDIILVHDRNLEDQFVAEGYGTQRWDVMYNDYIYLGPADDPANIASSPNLGDALNKMINHMKEGVNFISRGDNSGTHSKEKSLWPMAGQENVEAEDWYLSIGQGMGDTLIMANEMKAYALTDRGTYLSLLDKLPNLAVVFAGDESLFNPYGIIPVNPEMHSDVKYKEASLLVEFFISEEAQKIIGEFGVDKFGKPLFFPNAN